LNWWVEKCVEEVAGKRRLVAEKKEERHSPS